MTPCWPRNPARSGAGSGLRWVLDPLDGTTNYLYGVPVWAVSIAVEDADGWVSAVVYDPTRDEMFAATRGGGATLNGRPIGVSDAVLPERALVATGFSYGAEARVVQAQAVEYLLTRVRDVRRGGSAALDLAWVAAGRIDGFYEVPLKLWDRAAGELLVTEAGGTVSPARTDRGIERLGRGSLGPRSPPTAALLVATGTDLARLRKIQ